MANEVKKTRHHCWAEKNSAIELYKSGLTSIAVAEQLRISTRTICRWVQIAGISRPCGGSKLKHPIFVKIRATQLYKQGWFASQIANHFGIKRPTVSKWVREEGISRHRGAVNGSRNPAWKDNATIKHRGIRATRTYQKWKLTVLERDNFRCQGCGKVGGELHAHHILSFQRHDELRFSLDNGITLCRDCHMALHGKSQKDKSA